MKTKYRRVKLKFNLKLLGIFMITFLCAYPAFALIISEINFDPNGSDTDREWIEVLNDGSQSIDFTTYKFFENNVNHGIDSVSGDKTLQVGEYAVLVQDLNKFKSDFPNYMGKIYKSSFSLSNTGETLSLKDKDGAVLDTVTYRQSDTGAKDGEIIFLSGTNWMKGQASPGGASTISTGSGDTTNTSTTTTSTSTNSNTESESTTTQTYFSPNYYYRSYFPESEKIYVYSGENKSGISGGDMVFEARAVNGDKKNLSDATFFWSFGDGETTEGKTVRHTYKYPGEYIVYVEAYANGSKGEDKTYIKVTDPEIKIKLKNIVKDGISQKVLEILNNGLNEVDLGGYIIVSTSTTENLRKETILPKRLSILPKKSVTLGEVALKLATNTDSISLNYQSGKIISESTLFTKQEIKYKGTNIKTQVNLATGTFLSVLSKEDFDRVLQNNTSTTTKDSKTITQKKVIKKIGDARSSTNEIGSVIKASSTETSFSIQPQKSGFWQDWSRLFK